MKSITVVIPTTGSDYLEQALESVLKQTYKNIECWAIVDGNEFNERSNRIIKKFKNIKSMIIPENTGANGFYGHRIYAASGYLINTDYIMYLDQDNFMLPTHVESQINNCEINNLDWSYSLRNICSKEGEYLLDDNCESLGKWPIYISDDHNLVDTSCYCIKKDVIVRISNAWYGGWGGDRQFFYNLSKYFPNFNTTGLHTLCYRLDGNPGSVNVDFFIKGNEIMYSRYFGNFPWKNM